MAQTVRFIHAADLHLGAPFRGLQQVSPKWARRLADAIPEAFERFIQAALAHQVDFVVIAGDSFDLAHPSFDEYMLFIDGMERLNQAGISVYMVAGNHDPLVQWEQRFASLPANVHMFPAGDVSFFLHGKDGAPLAMLGGRSYEHLSWPDDQCIAQGISRQAACSALGTVAPFAIGIIHTGLDVDRFKAPVAPTQLYRQDMDYWALGHVHKPRVDDPKNPRIVFSGCIQGRALKETGPHGVNLVTLTQGAPAKVEVIPTASVAWAKVKVDASAAEALPDLAEATVQALYHENSLSHCDEMVARVSFTGTTHLHDLLQRPDVLEGLRRRINDEAPQFYCDVLLDKTKAPINRKALKKEGLFAATLLKLCDDGVGNPAADLEYLQEAFLAKGIPLPKVSGKKLERLADEAEGIALDMLGGEE